MSLLRRRRERLDKLFDIALVLLGVFSASELQVLTTTASLEQGNSNLQYLLRIFTMPLFVLLIGWLTKEIFADELSANWRMTLTEFCWNLWGFTLFYYLVIYVFATVVPDVAQYGVYLSFGLALLLIVFIQRTYRKAYRSMPDYFGRTRWLGYRTATFIIAYQVLLILVYPF